MSEENVVKEFTIVREKWIRGKAARYAGMVISRLVTDHGQMCCLGFYGVACGVPERNMLNVSFPNQVLPSRLNDGINQFFKLPNEQRDTQIRLIEANDKVDISAKERERTLKRLFRRIGVRVNFVSEKKRT